MDHPAPRGASLTASQPHVQRVAQRVTDEVERHHGQDGYWWLIFPVGACIVLTVMALNFIGDALRDAMDVRLRRR